MSVRTHISHVIESSSLSDPREIADKIIESATAAEKREWLDEVLPSIVAEVMRLERNHAMSMAHESRRRPVRSAKVAGVRDWWSKFLESRIPVDGVWKPVGELDAADLRSVIAEREKLAAEITAQAARFAHLLSLLAEYKVATVAELPRDAVAAVEAVAE